MFNNKHPFFKLNLLIFSLITIIIRFHVYTVFKRRVYAIGLSNFANIVFVRSIIIILDAAFEFITLMKNILIKLIDLIFVNLDKLINLIWANFYFSYLRMLIWEIRKGGFIIYLFVVVRVLMIVINKMIIMGSPLIFEIIMYTDPIIIDLGLNFDPVIINQSLSRGLLNRINLQNYESFIRNSLFIPNSEIRFHQLNLELSLLNLSIILESEIMSQKVMLHSEIRSNNLTLNLGTLNLGHFYNDFLFK